MQAPGLGYSPTWAKRAGGQSTGQAQWLQGGSASPERRPLRQRMTVGGVWQAYRSLGVLGMLAHSGQRVGPGIESDRSQVMRQRWGSPYPGRASMLPGHFPPPFPRPVENVASMEIAHSPAPPGDSHSRWKTLRVSPISHRPCGYFCPECKHREEHTRAASGSPGCEPWDLSACRYRHPGLTPWATGCRPAGSGRRPPTVGLQRISPSPTGAALAGAVATATTCSPDCRHQPA